MKYVTIDSAVGQTLERLEGQVILCDTKGRVLGLFSPLAEGQSIEDLELETPLSIAEIEELRKNKTGKPLEEILQRLGL